MAYVTLKPPKELKKFQLRQWYILVIDMIPYNYKTRPAISIAIMDLPPIMDKLKKANWSLSRKSFTRRYFKASGKKNISEEY